jgi:hypothetical protein
MLLTVIAGLTSQPQRGEIPKPRATPWVPRPPKPRASPARSSSQALPNPKSTIENHQSSIDPLHQHAVSGSDDPRNGLALT